MSNPFCKLNLEPSIVLFVLVSWFLVYGSRHEGLENERFLEGCTSTFGKHLGE